MELKRCLKLMDGFVWDVIRERREMMASSASCADSTDKKTDGKARNENQVHNAWSMDDVQAQERREEGDADHDNENNDSDNDGDGDGDNNGENADLLSRFMAVRDDQGRPLTDEQLRDVVMNMIMYARLRSLIILTHHPCSSSSTYTTDYTRLSISSRASHPCNADFLCFFGLVPAGTPPPRR